MPANQEQKQQLCHLHKLIITAFESIEKSERYASSESIEDLQSTIRDMVWEARVAQDYVNAAYERGNAMESRLIDYRRGIEYVGFVRDK
jgi:hypothetical protein